MQNGTRPPSSRAAIANFLAMEMAREAGLRAAAGERIVRFDVGQPFCGAPEAALAAMREALARDTLGYTDALGAMRLREGISAHYKRAYGLDVPPSRIAVTTGASGAFLLAFLALFDTADRVLLAAPGYPPYRHILTALGMRPTIAEAGPNHRLQLQAHHVREAAARETISGVLIASPANPTGTMLSEAELREIAAAARAANAPLISDEIYHGLVYDMPAVSALSVDPEAIVINSFSKYWAMTGWRVGWIVAPEPLITTIERLAQNLTVAPPTPSQAAALGALEAIEECEARRAIYAKNRARLIEALPRLGLPLAAAPDGAFYMLLDVSAHGSDSQDFCKRALNEAGVALTTGLDFDADRGRRWVRLAYARDEAEAEEGASRLAGWLGGRS
ncbi:MAG: pyridoxal phosphate-dependent aminotransferase [Hyphomonadaceae bacterium]